MIVLFKLAIALIVASALTVAFRMFARPTGPWSQFWTVFVLLFLSVWAAGIVMTPMEPLDEGLALTVYVAVGLGVGLALLFLLRGYPLRMPQGDEAKKQRPEAATIDKMFRLLFYTLIGAMVFTLVLRYFAW